MRLTITAFPTRDSRDQSQRSTSAFCFSTPLRQTARSEGKTLRTQDREVHQKLGANIQKTRYTASRKCHLKFRKRCVPPVSPATDIHHEATLNSVTRRRPYQIAASQGLNRQRRSTRLSKALAFTTPLPLTLSEQLAMLLHLLFCSRLREAIQTFSHEPLEDQSC